MFYVHTTIFFTKTDLMNKIKPRVSAGGYVVESEYIPSKWISSFRLRPLLFSCGALIVISFMKCQQL